MNRQEIQAGEAAEAVVMVDREDERRELEAALAEARSGRGRLYLVAGEPGIGKTRLAEAAAEWARAKSQLSLWGRAWESGVAPAYWPWTQVLRGLVASRDADALSAELGSGAAWVARLAPELADRLPGLRPARSEGSDKVRFKLFDAVASFLRAAAGNEALLIVLDDLHAADQASLALLEFVARELGGARILVLGLYQEAAALRRPEVKRLIGVLGRESGKITLRGLEDDHLASLVELSTGRRWPKGLTLGLHEATEGNPFFAKELVRLLAAEHNLEHALATGRHRFALPDNVRETIRRRFEPLSAGVLEALQAAAVIGREFRLATLEHAVGRGPLIGLLDEAVSAGLVIEIPGSIGHYRFTHNLIRETLYAELTGAERVQLHRSVGEALEHAWGGSPAHLAEIAHHYAAASPAGGADTALGYARRAGAEAMRAFAYEQAAELFGLALEVSEQLEPDQRRTAELLLEVGRAQARSDNRAARETLLAAADAARPLEDPGLMAEAALSMRAFPLGTGRLDDQPGGVLSESLERLGTGDSELRARVMARLAVSRYYWPGTAERREALVREAVAMARRLNDPGTLAHVLSNGQLATWGPDTTERDLAWMGEVLELIERLGDDELDLMTSNRQIDFLVELDDMAAADRALARLGARVTDASDPRMGAYVCLQRARMALVAGRYEEAERLNAEAASEGRRLHDLNIEQLVGAQLGAVRWHQGRMGELEDVARRVTATDTTPAWAAAKALACCQAGMLDEARRDLERMGSHGFLDLPRYNGWMITLALMAEVCTRLDDGRRARQLYELLAPFAGRNVVSPMGAWGGPVSRFLGILAGCCGDLEPAFAHLAAARDAGRRMGSPPVMVRTLVDEAELCLRRGAAGDRERALALLDEADGVAAGGEPDEAAARAAELRLELGGEPGGEEERRPAAISVPGRARLRNEGDVWSFDWEEGSVRLRDSKGVRCLAALLANPGVEIAAMELARARDPDARDGRAQAARAEFGEAGPGDAGPMLDGRAKSAYRQRLEELREELEEAESFNDPERAARAREEIEFLSHELSAAVGLGGRDRRAASAAERARVSVTKAIRSTIKRIGQHDEALARELENTIRTGTFCAYRPDPRRPVEWRVQGP